MTEPERTNLITWAEERHSAVTNALEHALGEFKAENWVSAKRIANGFLERHGYGPASEEEFLDAAETICPGLFDAS